MHFWNDGHLGLDKMDNEILLNKIGLRNSMILHKMCYITAEWHDFAINID